MYTTFEDALAPVEAGLSGSDAAPAVATSEPVTSGRPPSLTLLIVDDEPGLPEALADTFEDRGYRVLVASNGSGAREAAAKYTVDIALIDLVLPDMSGYEVVETLRTQNPRISCIMMTAFASLENVIAAANMNVRGFVLKPLDVSNVLMKVEEAAAYQKLERENSELLAALRNANARLEEMYDQEHRIADRLRRALLPRLPGEFGPFEVGDHYQAGVREAQVGGDLYDLIDLGDGCTGLMIADVSGKGLNAAVQAGMVRYSLRALAVLSMDPGEVITSLNRVICSHQEFSGFVTLFYGVFNGARNVLSYVNAGHEPPLLLSGAHNAVVSLDTTGPVVGVA
ncbi:MAG: fused response regulator/phosphatase, partial [Chloroflexi bacterium]|nr:fused response regulator/phosphatase [Chloroflexota bacterium]